LQKKAYSNPIVLVLTFLLLSIFSVAVFRGIFLGPSAAFVSHYKMYGSYFFTLGFLLSPMILSRIQKNRVLRFGILAFSAIYFIWSFPANLPQQKIIDGDLYKSLQQWAEDGDFRRVRGFFVRGADSYLFTALKNKTYSPVVLLPNDKLIDNIDILSSCPVDVNQIQSVTEKLDILHKNPNAAVIKILSLFDTGTKVTVTLCSSPADLSYRFEFISEPKIDTEEETHFVTRELIAPGNYTVFVKNGADLYKLETPFHNKQATR